MVTKVVHYFLSFLLLLLFNIQCIAQSLSKNALSLLSDTMKVTVKSKSNLPPDITFFFADVKYNGRVLKICEFGEMYLGGTKTMMNVNGKLEEFTIPYWDLFWHYLTRFNKPIWYVGKQRDWIVGQLRHVGGKNFKTMSSFLDFYKTNYVDGLSSARNRIDQHAGILLLNATMDYASRKKFMQEHPDILVINAHTKRFTGKHHVQTLFNKHPELDPLMPRWKVYKKQDSSFLFSQIITDIPADFYIIKPMKGVSSKGVIMVAREDLSATLKLLVEDKKRITPESHLAYWATDNHETFFVQEYAPSKSITLQGKPYDPTMHVVFFMSHDAGTITLDIVAAHWKIPPKSLDESCSLTEKHITQPLVANTSLHNLIDYQSFSDDFNHVKALMKNSIPLVYVKMLEHDV